jgi:hypothetical protein
MTSTSTAGRIRSGPLLLFFLGLLSLYSLSNERLLFRFCDYEKNTSFTQLPLHNKTQTRHSQKNHTQRTVHFLHPSDFGSYGEYYSGMWWQRLDSFRNTNYDDIGVPEDVAFKSYIYHHYRDIRLTHDWLDFMVEHLSQYVKRMMAFPAKDGVTQQLTTILTQYIQRTEPYDLFPDAAAPVTLAVVPVRVTSGIAEENDLLALELAATLISLWKVGMGRAIVVGISEYEQVLANQSFALVRDQMASFGRAMELHSIEYDGVSLEGKRIVAKLAALGLQTAFRQYDQQIEPDHVQAWLGSNPQRWKYVYFSEPDLVLNMRYDAISAISENLREGNLMAAHRTEAVPHERDFPLVDPQTVVGRVLPNQGVFAFVHDLDPKDAACCDHGRFYPAHRANPLVLDEVRFNAGCRSSWVYCGFLRKDIDYHNPATIMETHYRLIGYPLFTIKGGTGVPLVGSHQRMCLPQKRDLCDG